MAKTEIIELVKEIDKKVTFEGWVDAIRDHGNLVFLDVRDRSSVVQVVVFKKDLIPTASSFSPEDLIKVTGTVQKRPDKLINENIPTGSIEVASEELELISAAAELPFEVNQDTSNINELLRLEYRYLDLRTARMKENLKRRHELNLFLRNFLSEKGFWEVETPALSKGTPEGAREFIVPSRLQEGKFFVLPQSPQQYKQLLMVGGVEKYFQIARCFRDEDQRGDRQPEFTQLDIEMSFVTQEDILQILEPMMIEMAKKVFPEKKIAQIPFPRMTYAEAMEKYKSDKPDIRKNEDELAFLWIIDFPLFEQSESEKRIVSSHHPFTMPLAEDMDKLEKEPLKVRANAYDLVLNGFEMGSGSLRIYEKELQHKIFQILGLSEAEITGRFGHMLKAFTFSPPPHGGFAFGLDRLLAVALGEPNVREVIAFPKTGDAKDPLMGAPSDLPEITLKEAHITTVTRKK